MPSSWCLIPSSWAAPDPRDALDVETFRLIHRVRFYVMLVAVLALVVVAGWVGLHDQCARLTRDGATTTVLHSHGCQP